MPAAERVTFFNPTWPTRSSAPLVLSGMTLALLSWLIWHCLPAQNCSLRIGLAILEVILTSGRLSDSSLRLNLPLAGDARTSRGSNPIGHPPRPRFLLASSTPRSAASLDCIVFIQWPALTRTLSWATVILITSIDYELTQFCRLEPARLFRPVVESRLSSPREVVDDPVRNWGISQAARQSSPKRRFMIILGDPHMPDRSTNSKGSRCR